MAPRKDNISKIGQEAFTLLEEIYGKKSHIVPDSIYANHGRKKSHIVPDSNYANHGRVINNNHEAAKFYGGINLSKFSKRKSTTLAY